MYVWHCPTLPELRAPSLTLHSSFPKCVPTVPQRSPPPSKCALRLHLGGVLPSPCAGFDTSRATGQERLIPTRSDTHPLFLTRAHTLSDTLTEACSCTRTSSHWPSCPHTRQPTRLFPDSMCFMSFRFWKYVHFMFFLWSPRKICPFYVQITGEFQEKNSRLGWSME